MERWQSLGAFVVQFRESTDIAAGRLEGRIEHIASYKSARFESAEELLAFIGRVLSDLRDGGNR